MAATGRLGRVYVWDSPGWLELGTVRAVTYTVEPQPTERDAFGRSASLAQEVVIEFTLLQTTETEYRNTIDNVGTVSVFVSNSPWSPLPNDPDASTADGIILKDATLSVSGILDLGGGESAITVRLKKRVLHNDSSWINLLT
jgi:hypothetical protein